MRKPPTLASKLSLSAIIIATYEFSKRLTKGAGDERKSVNEISRKSVIAKATTVPRADDNEVGAFGIIQRTLHVQLRCAERDLHYV